MTVIYLNGTFVEDSQAKISVYDRSYLFGEGLFETFVSINGKIPFLKDHLNRLEWSCTHLSLEFPSTINFSEICQELLKKNDLKNARFKILLSRTGIAPSSQIKVKVESTALSEHRANQNSIDASNAVFIQNCVVFCEPHDDKKIPATYHLKIIKNMHNDALPLAAIKSTHYLTKLLARSEAHDSGFDDGILTNSKGQVTETTTANIFWIDKDGVLWTVMSDQGVLDGITKKNLINLIKNKGLKIRDGVITALELSNQREVFVTNSVIGIKPVSQIDQRQISGGETGSVTEMLQDLWKNKIAELLK